MGKSRAICETLSRPLRQDREEDGRHADHVSPYLDRGTVHEEGCGGGRQVPHDFEMDVRHGVLSGERQPEGSV